MSDLVPSVPETADPVGRSLAVVGFGMFSLLARTSLDDVVSLPGLAQRLHGAQPAAPANPLAALAAFDDDASVPVAEPVTEVEDDVLVLVEETPAEAEAEPVAPVAAPTLAMLNEISYLDT